MISGNELKNLRKAQNLSQEEVGKAIGLSKQTVGKYENGRLKEMSSSKIEILAKIYKVSPSYIMGWEEKKYSKEEELHIKNLRSMDENIRNEIFSRTASAAGLFPRKDVPTPNKATS